MSQSLREAGWGMVIKISANLFTVQIDILEHLFYYWDIHSQPEGNMQSKLGHLQVNVNPSNISFYKNLFGFLGWESIADEPEMFAAMVEGGASLWFMAGLKPQTTDYDGYGVNHIAIQVSAQKDVDSAVDYLKQNKIVCLFETPRHRPDFANKPTNTYYQVMFESPDHILFEIVYMGKKD
jgi:catechol 2,3-dioxygenase-like lactoylglutathione lyase family enzyme